MTWAGLDCVAKSNYFPFVGNFNLRVRENMCVTSDANKGSEGKRKADGREGINGKTSVTEKQIRQTCRHFSPTYIASEY